MSVTPEHLDCFCPTIEGARSRAARYRDEGFDLVAILDGARINGSEWSGFLVCARRRGGSASQVDLG